MTLLRIGTRGSKLALWQANWVASRLCGIYSDLSVEIVTIKTSGEKQPDVPLATLGNKGIFTDEIEAALLDRSIDVAVHSLKDLPTVLPDGLGIGAYCEREDPRDVLISKGGYLLDELPSGSQIGTSSLRRTAQILHLRPDLRCVAIRGNVDTRLRKLEQCEELSGIIIAAAGIIRLGQQDRITQYLNEEIFLPAPGQGVIALEISTERGVIRNLIAAVNCSSSEKEARAERSFLGTLEGGCQVPVGARAVCADEALNFVGMVASLEGSKVVRVSATGTDPEQVGRKAAEDALKQGAQEILAEISRDAGRDAS